MSLVELCDFEWGEGMHVCTLEKGHSEADHECFCPNGEGWHKQPECQCYVADPKYWFTHYGAVEPGSMYEPNPDCPVHRT
ncbi:hypothetical protein SEA_CHRISTIAN_31 [Arthrobacter phage Christian]|uniref:Uncharacterized protein n=1 Tax=Arthrobacter phage Christian TaxID=2015856 RepID=A0A222ZFC0_9CAUD|nr:hypothetical protein SEA_CHRISTIAN_31 [Arthrobacter phage Christian]WKW86757.1 hypothetical protein SEA_WONDERBOY_30 [Arthrobacter phage WonderBoy]